MEDKAQVQLVPMLAWEQFFQVLLGLLDVVATGEFPALGKTMDVGVDGEGWHAEGLSQNHRGGFVADAWECFELGERRWDVASMPFEE